MTIRQALREANQNLASYKLDVVETGDEMPYGLPYDLRVWDEGGLLETIGCDDSDIIMEIASQGEMYAEIESEEAIDD